MRKLQNKNARGGIGSVISLLRKSSIHMWIEVARCKRAKSPRLKVGSCSKIRIIIGVFPVIRLGLVDLLGPLALIDFGYFRFRFLPSLLALFRPLNVALGVCELFR